MVENTPLTPLGRATRAEQHQNHDLLQQMTLLCATVQSLGRQVQDVQSLGKQMQEGFAAEDKDDLDGTGSR